MKLIYILISLVVITSFSSCYKYSEELLIPTAPTNGRSVSDSVYLSKIILISKNSSTNILDTISQYEFYYDNLKRLNKIIDRDPIDNSIFYISYYFYNGNSLLPFKDSSNTFDTSGNHYIIDLSYFTYNNSNKLICDSNISISKNLITNTINTFTHLNKISYSNNKAYGLNYYFPITTTDEIRDTATLDANGNTIHQVSWEYYGGNLPTRLLNGFFTYDNKNSSLKMVNLPLSSFFDYDYENFLTKNNNLLTSNQNLVIKNYIYNTNNYPIQCNEVNNHNNTMNTYLFSYTAL